MRRYIVDRHPFVARDFFEIAQLIGEYASYSVAEKKIDQIELLIAKLIDFPHIGTIRDDISPGLRAIPCADKATICFTVNDDTHEVKIVCVTYAGQDWQTIARDRK
jgi:plasmid stabilization system protein ParE